MINYQYLFKEETCCFTIESSTGSSNSENVL